MEALIAFELSILDFIRANIVNPVLDEVMKFVSASGELGIVWLILAIVLIIFPKTRKAGLCVVLALVVGTIICSGIIKPIVARTRPYDISGAQLIVTPPHDYSFPSGHTLSSFAAAASVFIFNKAVGIPALIYAALMGFSRLYLYVHFPTDVLCGMIIGIIVAIMSALIISKLLKTSFMQKFEFFRKAKQ